MLGHMVVGSCAGPPDPTGKSAFLFLRVYQNHFPLFCEILNIDYLSSKRLYALARRIFLPEDCRLLWHRAKKIECDGQEYTYAGSDIQISGRRMSRDGLPHVIQTYISWHHA